MGKTIAAIATPSGEGGIGVVRISGDNAIMIADKVFRSASGKQLKDLNGYSALFGSVYDGDSKVDEAVALLFKAPKSYTGEDVVELSVHGGLYVVRKVLRTVLKFGAVMAERGEFTRRAFENGKLDMSQAEAVIDIISADGEQALRASLAAKDGAVTKKCAVIKDKLTFAAATVAAFSDFPDEEPEFSGIDRLEDLLTEAKFELNKLISGYDTGRLIKNGINTVIIGPPNAGKSTLMNLLSGVERSIVTPIAGTTRDIIEETVSLDGVVLRLCDTAGLRDTDDLVEKIGVERTKERIESADLIIAVVDSGAFGEFDLEVLKSLENRPSVVVFNKSDIATPDCLFAKQNGLRYVCMSAKSGKGLDEFTAAIKEVTGINCLTGDSGVYLNDRQHNCCVRAQRFVDDALNTLKSGMTVDAVGVCLDDALSALMELTGERVTIEVANKVFEHFCVGK